MKQQQLIIEVAPNLFALTSKARQEIMAENQLKQQRLAEETRQREEIAVSQISQLNEKIAKLEEKVRVLSGELRTRDEQIRNLQIHMKSVMGKNRNQHKEDRNQDKKIRQNTVNRSTAYPAMPLSAEAAMWLDMGSREHERQIVTGELETYDPRHDRSNIGYMDDDERYFQRLRDGEE
ncbi:hypothetical protein [Oceanobacillus massiliensis]|uniref:hypothetical protein n=1 Tax=Oceanobacillus massiliensis TaxID=1465765 RepID=UPI0002E7523D|nr:hypothetical protein [Oceanobacillus massiliensis]